MKKHILFLVHGMGSFEQDWSANLNQELSTIFDRCSTNGSFADFYEVFEIRYDQHFSEYLEEYRQNAKKFTAWAESLPSVDNNLVGELVSLTSTEPADNFLTSHVLDVLLYGLTLKRDQITARIAETIQDRLQNRDHSGWSTVGHSLGTRAVHDVLQAFYTTKSFRQAFGKPRVTCMLANVTRLLALREGDGIYKSAVFPSRGRTDGACYNYFSVKHELDPFTFVRSFDPPPDWGNGLVMNRGLYEGVAIPARELTKFNVHDFAHYLSHPSVHVPLINLTYDGPPIRKPLISQEMYLEAMEDFRQQTISEDLQTFAGELEALKEEKLKPFAELLRVWSKFKEMLQETRP